MRSARGTTSAHAENTSPLGVTGQWPRNYLRARGEYAWSVTYPDGASELPPRTRRIPHMETLCKEPSGTTSAHAENTLNELGLL